MLKMKCPRCQQEIVSALLSDMDLVPCPHCKEVVPVAEVMVFAEGFTFHRNDLIKRMFRYKTLLAEINKERELLEQNPEASNEGKRSLGRFSQALAEVMAGARNNLRIDFTEPIPLKYRFNSHIEQGYLVNISMSGACFEIDSNALFPKKKSSIVLEFSLPGINYVFFLSGTTSWIRKGNSIGVEFETLEQQDLDTMWAFITSAVE